MAVTIKTRYSTSVVAGLTVPAVTGGTPGNMIVAGELAFGGVAATGVLVMGNGTHGQNLIIGGSAFFDPIITNHIGGLYSKTGTGSNVLAKQPTISSPTLSGTVAITGALTVGADTVPIATVLFGTLTVGSDTNQRATILYGNLTVGVDGGTIEVTTLNGNLTVAGASAFSGAAVFSYANGISFKDLNNTPDPAYTIKANSGTNDALSTLFLPYTGTSSEAENTLATIGGIAQIFGSTKTWNGATITVPYGGTGATTLAANGVLYGNGTSAISATAISLTNSVLTGNGAAPSFQTNVTIGRLTLTDVTNAGALATLIVTPGPRTAVTTESSAVTVATNQLTITTGFATQRFNVFNAGTITAATALAVTTAATVAITGAPTATTATIGASYALLVEAGDVLFKGLIKAGSSTTTLTGTDGKIVSAALNTVGVAQGGTGATTLTTNGVLYGNGTSAISATAGTSAQVLTNASGVPTWGTVALANTAAVSGVLSPSNGGTGVSNAGSLTVAANVAFTGISTYTTTFVLPVSAAVSLTLPTATSTLATRDLSETLTNKTLTTPTIATINGVTAINGVNNTNLVITSGTGNGSTSGVTQFAGTNPVVFSVGATFGGANPTVTTAATGTDLTANHLVTRGYVDAVAQGLHMHSPADVILTTGNINSDSSTNGVTGIRTTTYTNNTISIAATSGFLTMTVDQEAITLWTRIIINLTDTSQQIYNGIYSKAMTPSNGVNITSIVLTRADDADVIADINGGDFILVQNGYTFKECGFVQSVTPGTGSDVLSNTAGVGTFKPVFVQFSQAGVIEAGAGLTKTGIRIDIVGTADSITVDADSIKISTTYPGQASIITLGTVTSGTIDGGTF